MSDKKDFIAGSADEVGKKLQENYDHLLAATKKWAEILAYDPWPQTGVTPKEVVWRKNKSKLYRYSGEGLKHRIPVLFTYALINKAYILDLTPGMSMVERLVKDGFDVYLLEWGDFEWEDRKLTLADFVYKYIARAAQKVAQLSHSEEISIVGYCMGGTMATMYASLFPRPIVRNLVLLAAPLRFDVGAGTETRWLETAFGHDVDKLVDTFELIPKEFVDIGVKMLKPVNNFIGTYSRLWKMVEEGVPVDNWKVLNKWVDDNINFPGGAYRQWINDCYHENKLVKGEFRLRGNAVNLGRITANLLVMAGVNDHLVRPPQAQAAMDALSSLDKEYHEFPIGHGGLVFGKVAREQVYPLLSEWLGARSD